MTRNDRFHVPGEDAPLALSLALVVLGAAGLTASASAATAPPVEPAATPTTVTPPPTPPPSPSTSTTPSASPSTTPSASPSTSSEAPAVCPPVVVHFAFAAPRPSPAAETSLRDLARALVESPTTTIVLHGHADALGNEDSNLRLSRFRAASVADILEKNGVARSRMTVRGFGAYQPVEGAPEVDASNRRVVIYLRAPCPSGLEEVIGP